MSTPDQPAPPQLTRRQLRELRDTASTPIITPEIEAEVAAAAAAAAPVETTAPVVVAPLPRAAEPAVVPEPPVADEIVDLDAPALTRRQARQQERLRTASVPVITPEEAAAHEASGGSEESVGAVEPAEAQEDSTGEAVEAAVHEQGAEWADPGEEWAEPAAEAVEESVEESGEEGTHESVDESAEPSVDDAAEAVDAPAEDVVDASAEDFEDESAHDDVEVSADEVVEESVKGAADEPAEQETDDDDAAPEQGDEPEADDEPADDEEPTEADADQRVVSSHFGAELLADGLGEFSPPPSFDQLLARAATPTGSLGVPNALILSQTPEAGSLVAPIAATGEILITGTFALPESFGSTGTVPGSSDGKDVDAVLVDGELPAASSPTPIAASAAVSTIKSAEDIIKPPAPEKGSKLMMALAITAGALALALAGVLIVAIATGVFR